MTNFTLTVLYFSLAFLLCHQKKDYSLIDVAWAGSFVLNLFLVLIKIKEINSAHYILATLILIWFLRLSLYLYLRSLGRAEDFRYQKLRSQYKTYPHIQIYFKIFMFQALLAFLLTLPFQFLEQIRPASSPYFILGVFIFLTGFFIELIADQQVANFKKDKQKGFLCQGLWKYSRHPNYFGEALLWWSFPLIINHPIALVTPIIMTTLLRFVSGVPMLEEKYKNNQEYQQYSKKTNAFVPWFTKRV